MTRSANELERLGLLIPELADSAQPNMQAYALAYVERYQGDVLQLEHEWGFLSAALFQAWRQERYAAVVALVAGLALPAGRLANLAEAEAILRLGIEASRRTGDQVQLAIFLNRLSGLLFMHGNYQEGWRLWSSSLELAAAAGASGLWEPLSTFAYITDAYLADRLGVRSADPRFMQTLHAACCGADPESLIVALFVKGFYARLMGDADHAFDDLSASLRSLALQPPDVSSASPRQLLTLVVQAELARAQNDYTRSQMYTESALALAQVFSDPYTVAALLVDQGVFICRVGQFADLPATYHRLRALACQVKSHQAQHYSRRFARVLDEHLPGRVAEVSEPLSEREQEVLELVAAGCSNQEIARQLVVTPATVKKHLEHIYLKLDVHSRTAALAKARLFSVLA
jgi:DNA-binding NarL/FixJ family response regulator